MVLKAKLYRPQGRKNLVPRPKLSRILDQALSCPLTIVAAPAGFGKTTAVTSWLEETAAAFDVAWLSIDEGDNDLIRFWRYLLAALQQVDETLAPTAVALLNGSQTAAPEGIATAVTNDLFDSPPSRPLLLVIDDYHLITTPAIHQSLNFLLDHLPPLLHLLLTTRADPPLGLARRRARQQLVDVRAADLRFSADESGALLNERLRLALTAAEIETLQQRTEGWVTGLQLLALSLRDATDRAALIRAVAGSDRYIADYLIEEVLTHLPEAQREFLLRTAPLNRLSADLCAAVLPFLTVDEIQQQLETLDQQNIFLIPLDNERRWYRYHHLLATLLQQQLRQIIGDDELRQLYRLAAAWHAGQNELEIAIDYGLKAADDDQVGEWLFQLVKEQPDLIDIQLEWLEKLPEEAFASRPLLRAVQAQKLYLQPDFSLFNRIIALLDKAEAAIPDFPEQKVDILSIAASIRMLVWVLGGKVDFSEALAYGHRVWDDLYPDHPNALGPIAYTLALIYDKYGFFDEAQIWFGKMLALIDEMADSAMYPAQAVYMLSLSQQGKVYEAITHGRALEQRFSEPRHPMTGAIDVIMGLLYGRQFNLGEALPRLERGAALCHLIGEYGMELSAYSLLARLTMVQGEIEAALTHWERAKAITPTEIDIAPQRVRLLARVRPQRPAWQAEIDGWITTHRWLLDAEPSNHFDLPSSRLFEQQTTIAQLLVQQYRSAHSAPLEPVYDMLGRQLARLENTPLLSKKMWIHLLLASGFEAEGRLSEALVAMQEALHFGRIIGEKIAFLELREPAGRLLAQIDKEEPYLQELYRLLVEQAAPPAAAAADTSPLLAEPLTDRELEVLELIAAGLTNKEIGRRLHLSANTVRVHASNIYGKLGISGRTAAVAAARSLGLL